MRGPSTADSPGKATLGAGRERASEAACSAEMDEPAWTGGIRMYVITYRGIPMRKRLSEPERPTGAQDSRRAPARVSAITWRPTPSESWNVALATPELAT